MIMNFNELELVDAPEIIAEKSWVHAGLGTLTELVCHVDASPAAIVNFCFYFLFFFFK